MHVGHYEVRQSALWSVLDTLTPALIISVTFYKGHIYIAVIRHYILYIHIISYKVVHSTVLDILTP